MEEAPLGGLSPQVFLRRHWQKRPLLVRGALPGFRGVIEKRALFALAGRGDVESRLVRRVRARDRVRRGGNGWRVEHGPLSAAAFARLRGKRDWTLLVNGVNHHRAEAERLLRRFAFIPQARLDDVMVSYAAPGGGVGPHADSYDVFLVQGAGRRVWRLARPRRFSEVPDAPLRQIAGFRADEELLAEPGDILYLPPGWGHDGVALEDCHTCSVGFRAPRGAELAAAFLDFLHERGLRDAAYRDPGLRPAAHPARISGGLLAFAERELGRIRWGHGEVAEFLGRYLSTPKPNVVFSRPRRRRARTLQGRTALLDPKTQLLYLGARFFINGDSFSPRPAQRFMLAALADRRMASGAALARAGLAGLICEWQQAGLLTLAPRT